MKKKLTAFLLSAVMILFCFAPISKAGQLSTSDWITGDGWGSITENSDGTFTFKGDDVLNEDNSHRGPYTKANATSLHDGDIIEQTPVYINPSTWKAGEKFTLTVASTAQTVCTRQSFLHCFSETTTAV